MDSAIQLAGWALIHFTWQGTIAALAAAAALRVLRRASPQARYAVGCVALAAMLLAPALTLLDLSAGATAPTVIRSAASAARATDAIAPSSWRARAEPAAPAGISIRARVDAALPFLVFIWSIGVAVLFVRLAGGWMKLRTMHRRALAAAASRWDEVSGPIAASLGMTRRIHVVDSDQVDTPTVLGWTRPVILLPLAVLANLTPQQVEAILTHELAHVRRHDYVVNLLQTIAEMLLFYHPAVWWISARIRHEREQCCDDVVVRRCGDAIGYAAALTELAAWSADRATLTPAATGGSLLARVRRVLTPPRHDDRPIASAMLATAILVLVVAGGTLAARAITMQPVTGSDAPVRRAVPDVPSVVAAVPAVPAAAAVPATAAVASTRPTRPASPAATVAASTSAAAEPFVVLAPQQALPPPPPPPPPAPPQPFTRAATDHFEVVFAPALASSWQRIEEGAERAYAMISGELRHDLAVRPTLVVFRTQADLQQALAAGQVLGASDGPRILIALDEPPSRLALTLVHEITHAFLFDIVPTQSLSVLPWVSEGLADYLTEEWDDGDLALLYERVTAKAIPRISELGAAPAGDPRLIHSLGHAAFDYIERRWRREGMRRLIATMRQRGGNGADDVMRTALGVSADEFDAGFNEYLTVLWGNRAQAEIHRRLEQLRAEMERRVAPMPAPGTRAPL